MRRGFIFILILAIIGGVLTFVFINLFTEKDTNALTNSLNQSVSAGVLDEDGEDYVTVKNALDQLKSLVDDAETQNEIFEISAALDAYMIMGEFFNSQMAFSTFNNVYKDNRGSIESSLKKADTSLEKVADYLNENATISGGSPFWQAQAWSNIDADVNETVNQINNAMKRLILVYEASIESIFANNDFSALIFDVVDTYLTEIANGELAETAAGSKLEYFTKDYLSTTTSDTIFSYQYDESLKSTVKNINEKGNNWETDYQNFLSGSLGRG